ncbi:MAG: N-acetylmuramic acid 6-phosphate etherase, partial [Candidatus Latescibacteria bacterium]|nr:N-acetylmuramic acid 6-phosphate etherase [Candidatus Latescibacterota bacterium]
MTDWSRLLTEQRNPASEQIDQLDSLELVRLINSQDALVPAAVEAVLSDVAAAVDLVTESLSAGGRLFYLGAGTSGRLGILDASECPPTFSSDPKQVQGLIAGGEQAVFQAVEGAEDDARGAVAELDELGVGSLDAVVGIAASGVTPWVLGGLAHARSCGCGTVFFTCSPSAAASVDVDVVIVPEVGPEVVTGSTRMKAGTATKLVLNTVTTGAMIRLGKTYGNLMVDLQPSNAKLRDRMTRILSTLAGLDTDTSRSRLEAAGWELKLALVMELCDTDADTARQRLAAAGGRVRVAISG